MAFLYEYIYHFIYYVFYISKKHIFHENILLGLWYLIEQCLTNWFSIKGSNDLVSNILYDNRDRV